MCSSLTEVTFLLEIINDIVVSNRELAKLLVVKNRSRLT